MSPDQLRAKQWQLMDQMYGHDPLVQKLANQQYQANLVEANKLGLDKDVDCSDVDPCLFEVYRNAYKGDKGINPRGLVTLEEVTQYLRKRGLINSNTYTRKEAA